ncbi:MAG: type I-E CRISPR-associated protein Cse1/CasA [Hyphomicrobiaceae bacterium]
MPEHFSLVARAWLPVALSDGRREFVRLRDITSTVDGQDIIRLATGRPDCDISLTEFLIGLLAISIGPQNDGEWGQRYANPPSTDELDAALKAFEPALILDGDGPRFFQDREALEGAATPIEALFMDVPAEHFQVEGRTKVLSRTGAALALAALQTSAPSGGAGHRTSLRGGGPLTTLVIPGTTGGIEPTLWQRLWANVPLALTSEPEQAAHVFPWLGPTRTSEKGGQITTPDHVHPAQAFFGMPRRIRLVFEENINQRPCDLTGLVDEVIVTGYVTRPWGTNYTAWSRGHPLSPYYKAKEADPEFLPLHLKSSRIGYRQWLGMVTDAQKGLRVPAKCVTAFPDIAGEIEDDFPDIARSARLLVAGYAMDNMKPLDFAEALLPLIVSSKPDVNREIKKLAHNWVQAADTVASQLVSAVKLALYGDSAKADRDSTPLEAVKSRFWADTENDFYDKLRAAAASIESYSGDMADLQLVFTPGAGAGWLACLKRQALAIFDDAVPVEDADSKNIKDIIDGRKLLGLMLAGYGKGGSALFELLNQPPAETKPKKGRKAA